MFGFETNQKQINKLEAKVRNLESYVTGGVFGIGLDEKIKDSNRSADSVRKELDATKKRLSVLEEIVREAGLITDFDSDEVKIREDRYFDIFGGYTTKNIPYQINKVKTK